MIHGYKNSFASSSVASLKSWFILTLPSLAPILPLSLPLFSPVAAPDLLDPKSATHNTKPRLSFSSKPIVFNSGDDCDTLTTVMKWKTVVAIFLLVVLYLIIGATVFKALEQPQESSQKYLIVKEKINFLSRHACVNTSELEDLVKVRTLAVRH